MYSFTDFLGAGLVTSSKSKMYRGIPSVLFFKMYASSPGSYSWFRLLMKACHQMLAKKCKVLTIAYL
jgi:hypothetical protein